jgi:hypothetical protein
MIIRTRKLPATTRDGERMRATAEKGASLTIPFPYGDVDPSQRVAYALARGVFGIDEYNQIVRVGENRWEVQS